MPSWVRRTFGWSNSRESWEERFGALVLIAGAALAIAFHNRMSVEGALVVWGLIGVTSLVLLRRGWLRLFGPVLFYDMIRLARQGKQVWFRGVYALLLLFLLFVCFLGSRHTGMSQAQAESYLARTFFEWFISSQFVVVLLLTPAYVGGAIAEEKDRRTLEFLLATDLRSREIVLSKFVARLANLTIFLLAGLPLISMIQFLGGVDPLLVQAGFGATALTVVGLGGLSILTSTYFKKPRDAIAVTYLFIVAYLTISFLAYSAQVARLSVLSAPVWFGSNPPTLNDLLGAFNAGNIFVYLPEVQRAGVAGRLEHEIPGLLAKYALFHIPVALVCTAWAVLRMRTVALRQMIDRGASKAARRVSKKPPVGKRPMLWKEVFAEGGIRMNWMTWVVVAILLAATFVPVVLLLVDHLAQPYQLRHDWRTLAGKVNIFVRLAGTVVGSLTLLAVGVRAASSYSGERERQTLDSLLITPLDSTPMLVGKWLGAIFSVRLAWLWLGLIWGIGIAFGGLSPWALPLIAVTWLVFAAFMATLGLWFSILSRSSLRATLWTLLTVAGVGLGHWLPWMCCIVIPGLAGNIDYLAKVQGGLTPPVALFSVAFYGGEFSAPDRQTWIEMIGFSLFGIFAWAVATVLLWSGLTLRFRSITLREEFTRPERGWVARRVRPARLDPAAEPHSRPLVPPTALPVSPEPRSAAPPPQPPTRIVGAKLIDETWEVPRPSQPGEQEPGS